MKNINIYFFFFPSPIFPFRFYLRPFQGHLSSHGKNIPIYLPDVIVQADISRVRQVFLKLLYTVIGEYCVGIKALAHTPTHIFVVVQTKAKKKYQNLIQVKIEFNISKTDIIVNSVLPLLILLMNIIFFITQYWVPQK